MSLKCADKQKTYKAIIAISLNWNKIAWVDINKNIALTKPEFCSKVSKSSPVIRPVTVEIHAAVLTSLKYLSL